MIGIQESFELIQSFMLARNYIIKPFNSVIHNVGPLENFLKMNEDFNASSQIIPLQIFNHIRFD